MEHITKLFASKGVANSHIWIEGQRLSDAGFTVGMEYSQFWFKDRLKLTTASIIVDVDNVVKTTRRRVVASGNNAAIRIEGDRVNRTFAGFDKVRCSFGNGVIEIIGYKEEGCTTTSSESTNQENQESGASLHSAKHSPISSIESHTKTLSKEEA